MRSTHAYHYFNPRSVRFLPAWLVMLLGFLLMIFVSIAIAIMGLFGFVVVMIGRLVSRIKSALGRPAPARKEKRWFTVDAGTAPQPEKPATIAMQREADGTWTRTDRP